MLSREREGDGEAPWQGHDHIQSWKVSTKSPFPAPVVPPRAILGRRAHPKEPKKKELFGNVRKGFGVACAGPVSLILTERPRAGSTAEFLLPAWPGVTPLGLEVLLWFR